MGGFLALLAYLHAAGVMVEHVHIPSPDGTSLDAALVRPASQPHEGGPVPAASARGAVVALHGCGGPFPNRDGNWAVALAREGYTVLLPDSFGSRGLGSQCRVRNRAVTPSGKRRQDAIAAAEWLTAQPGIVPVRAEVDGVGAGAGGSGGVAPPGSGLQRVEAGVIGRHAIGPDGINTNGVAPAKVAAGRVTSDGIALLGWSNGGGTVLATARQAPDLPPNQFRRFVAFYPGCATRAKDPGWKPAAPLMVLVGEADDWTPAAPCRDLAARFPDLITLLVYPGAYHDFDAVGKPVRVLRGLATPPSGTGQAHAGSDPDARSDAFSRVPAFLAGH